MHKILVIGAGKSAGVLIPYLNEQAQELGWSVRVVDQDLDHVRGQVAGLSCVEAGELDVEDSKARDAEVKAVDLVVSMVPAHMHLPIATACVRSKTHFVSASYVAPEMRALDEQAHRAGVTLLNEVGVDPGIDHMSAMEKLDRLRDGGAKIVAFETFTGGLLTDAADDNPWHYKFTWNPRNVVLAGQGGVRFKHNGRPKYIPYHRLFRRYETVTIPEYGSFEGYPNRDSLKYRDHYGLWDVDTIYRATLRRPGFCNAWDCLVQLGLTDDSFEMEDLEKTTYREWVNAFLWYDESMSVELKVRAYLKLDLNSKEFDALEWLGLFEDRSIGLARATPAQVLQKLLEKKWKFQPHDRDLIAMLHKTTYELEGKLWLEQSSMVALGEDKSQTAMAKTVGLCAGIGAKLVLQGVINRRGVLIPTLPHVYEPILGELREHGIFFRDERKVMG